MIDKILAWISLQLIKLYQLILSPDKWIPSLRLKGRVCRHEPHCSQYALEHMQRFWFFKSIIPIMDRVSNCTAWHGKIIDPVPADATMLQCYNATMSKNSETLKHWNIEALKPLRVIFFSSAPIGVPFLEALWNDERFEIVWVVTQPDQPAGRGLEMKSSIIKKFASRFMQEKWIIDSNFIQTPNTLKFDSKKYPWEWEQFQARLEKLKPDYFVVTAYGKLMPQHTLDIPKIAPINIHWSLLPKYRWATPIQTALLNWDNKTGMTLIIMSAGMDEGDIIGVKEIKLEPNTNSKQLYDIFGIVWPDFVNDILLQFAWWKIKPSIQDSSKATFVHKIDKEQSQVDPFANTLDEVLRKYNGYYGWPKVYFIYKEKRVIIEHIEINPDQYNNSKSTLLVDNKNNLNPAVMQLLLKPEGKKTMSWEERKRWFLRK